MDRWRSLAFGVLAVTLAASCLAACTEEDEMPAVKHPVGATTSPGAAVNPAATPEVSESQQPSAADESAAPVDQEPEAVGAPPDDADPSSLTEFHSTLDPYGTWREDPTYGTVWTPAPETVGTDFTPYVSGGHWLYEDDEYLWASDYSWGWAPFHYGRWVYAPYAGWEWIPGRAYAGAWVSWRYGVGSWGYVGWAPLPPTWGWRGGVAVGIGFVPFAPYAFVPTSHLFAPAVGAHLVAGADIRVVATNTRPWSAPMAGHVVAHPTVGGPPPSVLHIASPQVAGAAAHDPGIARARAFAQASTPSGGRGASSSVSAAPRNAGLAASPYGGHAAARLGETGPSHFGGRMGTGFVGSQPLAPAYGGTPRPYFAQRGSSPGATSPSAPRAMPSQSPAHMAPSGGGFSAPASHPSGGYSGGGGGGFHGGGGGFHGGGGGGFHGGGGGHGGGHR